MRTITFNELRKIKDSLPSGSMHRIADELNLDVDTVRNFFGGHNFKEGKSVGIHLEPGPDGGLVMLDDTTVLEKALNILDEVANKKYSELDMDVATIIDSYNLDFVILDTQNEDEIREMFLRLQNGTTLKAQEKRNAMPGRMRDFIKGLTNHEFFTKVHFSNTRFTYDLIAAQMTLLELNKGICNIKDRDLNVLYNYAKNLNCEKILKSYMEVLL